MPVFLSEIPFRSPQNALKIGRGHRTIPHIDAKEQAFSQHLSHLMAKQLGFLNFFLAQDMPKRRVFSTVSRVKP